jgi:predicted Fe-S protein YdhL (DUF1289 family)
LNKFDSQILFQQLVKAYNKAQDKDFIDMIKHKDEQHEDGSVALTPALLMAHALCKFEICSELHEWKEQTPEQKEIISLTSQLQALQKKNKSNKKKSTDDNQAATGGRQMTPNQEIQAPSTLDEETTNGWQGHNPTEQQAVLVMPSTPALAMP